MQKKMKITGMTAAILTSVSMTPTTAVADDLLQDAGSWLQVVGEGSLNVVDPNLEKGRIWLEGQSRWDDNWNSLVSRRSSRSPGLFAQRPRNYLGGL
jgi:hypothetical protein